MTGFIDTYNNQQGYDERFAGKDVGPYVGVVKYTNDPTRQGKLGVNIPELTLTNNPSPADCIWCNYLSPFYGAKSVEATSKSDPNDYKSTQHSYGFWAVPPDIDTEVLVIFAKGEANRKNAFWIGCVQQALTNQQLPGYGSSTETIRTNENAREAYGIQRKTNYGTDFLPVGEKNRRIIEAAQTADFAESIKYPVNDILADQLLSEGLIQDNVRGTTSSSARRETPSQVFGLSTPGRVREDSRTLNIGVNADTIRPDRNPGHSFVMDDGDVDGANQQVRLRTASGHQLLMNDTEGVVYIANGSGKAFIEMDKDGTISVYSDGGINLRSSRDFNLHSETNINFHAKGTINFTSENHLALNAEGYIFAMGEKGILNSSQNGSIRHYAKDGISSFTNGTQLHGAGGRIDLAGSQVHFNSVGAQSTWGPSWLTPDAIGIKVTEGLIDIDDDSPLLGGKANKIDNKTTVTDFVTHEPYDRQSSTARTKNFINEAMAEIKKASPDLSATELKVIKAELLKQPSIKAISEKLNNVVKLNDKIKLPVQNLNTLVSKANDIEKLISDPKGAAMNFIHGKIASIKTQAFNAVRSFFRF
tara:strand:+ start:1671 stop:3434 length:1764 start_codon:yes stop_codon:yes gene_type:complete